MKKNRTLLKSKINGLLFLSKTMYDEKTDHVFYKVTMLKNRTFLNFSISTYLEYLDKYFEIVK